MYASIYVCFVFVLFCFLLNGISNFVDYWMPKPFLEKKIMIIQPILGEIRGSYIFHAPDPAAEVVT